MELKSLFLGLTFTIGIFALKSGVGLHYLFTQRHSLKGRLLLSIGSALAYFLSSFLSRLVLLGSPDRRYRCLFFSIYRKEKVAED